MASCVDSSHFPLGFPVYEPSFARACWISLIRSGVGAFWPRSRRLDLLGDLFPCEALLAEEPAGFRGAGLLACAESENTPSPAAKSSDEARCVAFRRFMRIARVAALLLVVRRNFAGQVHRRHPVGVLAAKNLEYDIVAGLQAGHRFAVVSNGIDGRAIDFRDHVPACE